VTAPATTISEAPGPESVFAEDEINTTEIPFEGLLDDFGATGSCRTRLVNSASAIIDVREKCHAKGRTGLANDKPSSCLGNGTQCSPRNPTARPHTATKDKEGSNPDLFNDIEYSQDQSNKEARLYQSRFTRRPRDTTEAESSPDPEETPTQPSLSDSVLKELSDYPDPVPGPNVPEFFKDGVIDPTTLPEHLRGFVAKL